jgi:hypothetical protein
MTSRPYPIRDQLTDAIGLLLLCVVVFPPLFIAADWLRHGVL